MAQDVKKPEASSGRMQRYDNPFAAMRAEMDRVLDSFLGRGVLESPRWPGPAWTEPSFPDVDVRDTGKEIVVEAELPGMEEKDVSLTLNDGVLTLRGEKKSERDEKKDNYHITERSFGSFQRSFRFGDAVDPEKVTASFEKGVLRVTLGKRAEAVKAEKRIPIGKQRPSNRESGAV